MWFLFFEFLIVILGFFIKKISSFSISSFNSNWWCCYVFQFGSHNFDGLWIGLHNFFRLGALSLMTWVMRFFFKKKLYNPFYYQGIQILWSRSLVWWDISDWLRSDYQDYKFVMTGIFFFVIFYLISKPKHHFFEEKNLIPQWSTYTKASLKDFYMNCLAYATKIDIFFFKKKLLNKYNDKTYIDIDIYKTLYL